MVKKQLLYDSILSLNCYKYNHDLTHLLYDNKEPSQSTSTASNVLSWEKYCYHQCYTAAVATVTAVTIRCSYKIFVVCHPSSADMMSHPNSNN